VKNSVFNSIALVAVAANAQNPEDLKIIKAMVREAQAELMSGEGVIGLRNKSVDYHKASLGKTDRESMIKSMAFDLQCYYSDSLMSKLMKIDPNPYFTQAKMTERWSSLMGTRNFSTKEEVQTIIQFLFKSVQEEASIIAAQSHPESIESAEKQPIKDKQQIEEHAFKQSRAVFVANRTKYAKELNAVDRIIINITADWSYRLTPIEGGRFRINEGTDGGDIFSGIFSALPQSDYQKHFETGKNLHKWIMGLDGSTTSQAMAKLSTLVGKYYVLKGDAYQIVCDRDYPRDGKHVFEMFGSERYVGNTHSFLTFSCQSKTKVPPYRIAPTIARFTGFHLGKNRDGKTIIIPEIKIVWMYMGIPHSRNDGTSELIINY